MDLKEMSLADLKSLAKEKGIKGVSALKKGELLELLMANEGGAKSVKALEQPQEKVEESVKALEQPQEIENKAVRQVRTYSNYDSSNSTGLRNRTADNTRATDINRAVNNNKTTDNFRNNDNYRSVDNNRRVATNNGSTNVENSNAKPFDPSVLDTGIEREGIFEQKEGENFGFIRCDNYLPGENDVYISPAQIRRFGLRTGDYIKGNLKIRTSAEKYQGLAILKSVNGVNPDLVPRRPRFEDLTPIFPHERIHLETPRCTPAMRLVDLISPVGKGQRGMIVSQPKAGKTTLLKQVANAITANHPDMQIIILLIDERPEEVTDIKESIKSDNVEVIYSTFDELPENHKRVSEMVIERAKRLVEHGQDVCILLDSITRLARAYNLTVANSGRTLSGGLDPAALHMPKKFFGAARCMREGGSLTILATALVETGSRMDDVVFEEFKGTGNMELVLDRSLSERRVFPAIDLRKSGTRREDLLLSPEEYEAVYLMRTQLNGAKSEDAIETILNNVKKTKNNAELISLVRGVGIFGK